MVTETVVELVDSVDCTSTDLPAGHADDIWFKAGCFTFTMQSPDSLQIGRVASRYY
jgi:hypothetical protein